VNTNSFITNVNILVDNLEEISSFNYLSSNEQTLKDFVESGVSQYLPLVKDLAKGTQQGKRQISLNIYRKLPIDIQTNLEIFFNQYSISNVNTKFDYSYYVPGLTTYRAVKFVLKDATEITYNFDSASINTSSVAVIFNQVNLALSAHSDVITNTSTNSVQYRTLDDSILFYDSLAAPSNIEQIFLITTTGSMQAFDWFSSTSSVEFVANNINEIRDITSEVIDVKHEIQTIADGANATLTTTNTLVTQSNAALSTTNGLVNSLNNIISTLVTLNWTNSTLVCAYNGTFIGNIPTTATPLSTFAPPVTSLNANNYTVVNVSSPVNGTDAANKNYVDSAIQGLDPKQSVKAATTANIATLSGTLTIDGITLAAGDRVLVKDQTTASQNGIYIVSSGTWTRAPDADIWNELVGAYCFVEQGTVNADLGFVCTVDQVGTLGTTSITWINFSGAGSFTAGNGLSKSGNTLAVLGTTNRITVSGSGVDIASNYVGQNSITTLGTITTGTWTGSIIGLAYGGTGANLSGATDGTIFKKSGTALVAAVAGTDYYNTSSTIDGGTF
jgi:hypothetical protein